jgi:hypothetical protein
MKPDFFFIPSSAVSTWPVNSSRVIFGFPGAGFSSPGIPSSSFRNIPSSVSLVPVSFSPGFSPASTSSNHSCSARFVLSISFSAYFYYKCTTKNVYVELTDSKVLYSIRYL